MDLLRGGCMKATGHSLSLALWCLLLDGGSLKPHHNRTLGIGIASAYSRKNLRVNPTVSRIALACFKSAESQPAESRDVANRPTRAPVGVWAEAIPRNRGSGNAMLAPTRSKPAQLLGEISHPIASNCQALLICRRTLPRRAADVGEEAKFFVPSSSLSLSLSLALV
ncbi:hypothetical protein LI328DRAFT_159359 [Trichoderma asperelloides]|nr:hypothetical protein LI328DRAFT_159359 [Trichoderma asperelloides]